MALDEDWTMWQGILRRNPPLTFEELTAGDTFVCFPLPGDDEGHGGFRGSSYLFRKLTPTNSVRIVDNVVCSNPDGMRVIRILVAPTDEHGTISPTPVRYEVTKIHTAQSVTDEEIRAERDRACECRPGLSADDRLPLRSGDHAALHDCDVDTFDLCLVALGENPFHSPRSTQEALLMQIDARARIAEILNERDAHGSSR